MKIIRNIIFISASTAILLMSLSASSFALVSGAIQGRDLNLTSDNVFVTTLAGSVGISGYSDGIGSAAKFYYPQGITTDGKSLYIADSNNHTVRKIVIATGVVTTLAGSAGISGSSDGIGLAARFNYPAGLTTDGMNLYVADHYDSIIRKIVIATGDVTTIAGSAGSYGSSDGTGSAARFRQPFGIATDGTNLYVADRLNYTVRKIVIATGVVTTLAGSVGISGSSDGIGSAARFNQFYGITTDGTNLYIADCNNHTIRKIVIATGVVTTLAGSAGISGSSDGIGSAARFNYPVSLTTDGMNLYVGDGNKNLIRKIVIATGVVTTLAGAGGAMFYSPWGLTTDGMNLYVADTYHETIRTISGAPLPAPLKGDVNNDGVVNMADAVLALQINTGMTIPGVRSDYLSSGSDVNNNSKIGLEEVLYILQAVSGLRAETPATYFVRYSASGTISVGGKGVSGVTVTLSGQSSATTTTDDSGNYTFNGLANGSYTVTPSMPGYAFSPANSMTNVSEADIVGHNFVATGSGTNLNVVQINNAASPVIAAVTDSAGQEKLALIGTKDSSGAPVSVTQALYISASGEAGTLQLGADGLPESMSDSVGNRVTFANFTDTTMDVTLFDPAGNKVAGPATVNVDPAVLATIRLASGTRAAASIHALSQASGELWGISTQDWIKIEANAMGMAAGLGGCALVILGGASGIGTPLAAVGAFSCMSTLISAVRQISQKDNPPWLDYFNVAGSDMDCILGFAKDDFQACVSLAIDVIGLVPTVLTTLPSAPTGLTVSAIQQGQIKIYWSGSTGDVAGYRVYRNGGQIADWHGVVYTDTNVIPGTQYCYTVVAHDTAEHSSRPSDQLCVTIPVAELFVSSTTPGNSNIGGPGISAVFATFNKAIDPSTLNTSTFTVTGSSGPITGTVSYNAATKSAIFSPTPNLGSGASYTATVSTGVKDLAGNPLASSYSWNFATTTTLAVNGFASGYSTSTSPYAPTINLSGNGFNAVTQISWSCTKPDGTNCAAITPWTLANWSDEFKLTGNTVASVTPTLLLMRK